MPYNFGDWSSIGSDIGAKMTGRPSARQAKEADRALAIEMAQDKEEYQREQDKIKNFAAYGGYDPEQVMAGSAQEAMLSDPDLTAFQAKMTSRFNPADERALRGFREKIGSRDMTFEQRKELKAHPSGGTVNKYAGMGAGGEYSGLIPQKPKDYLPWSIKHPIATMGTQSKEEADALRKKWENKPAGKDTLKLY